MSGPARKGRRLSEEEIELWRTVAATIEARPGSILPSRAAPPPPVAPPPAPVAAPPARRATAAPYSPPMAVPRRDMLPLAPLERKFRQRVSRGRIEIERAMDLHGLTQAEAHGALRGFLRTAQADGARLVLVVTGKGSRSPIHEDPTFVQGVLRRAVPHWLREADLRNVVMSFEEASLPHGGTGALYIRLRRKPGVG